MQRKVARHFRRMGQAFPQAGLAALYRAYVPEG